MTPKALLSVFNKAGLVEFAQELLNLGFELIASGGTARRLKEADLPVQDVAELVGGGAILGHRVVTLSREVHAGLLATRNDVDLLEMEKLGLPYIDLVCVDLYPLQQEIAKPEATRESVIEQTDIGGPTMLRSAAKGRRIVICNLARRQSVIDWLKAGQPNADSFITDLAAEAEGVVADYCLASARYHSGGNIDGFVGTQVAALRYGENPSHASALFSFQRDHPLALDKFEQVGGTTPSHINLTDLDRLARTVLQIATTFEKNTGHVPCIAVVVKHGNACGAAVADHPEIALQKMIMGDPMAIFGGVVMVNFVVDESLATILRTYGMPEGERRLLDGVIAPSFTNHADEVLERKKSGKCRMWVNSALTNLSQKYLEQVQYRPVCGGFLRQTGVPFILDVEDDRMERSAPARRRQELDLILAFAIGSTSLSNTITLVRDAMLIGNAVGQHARVRAAKLALMIARESGHGLKSRNQFRRLFEWLGLIKRKVGGVAYGDSFFPEPDGLEVLAKAGVKLIFASSGSVNDAVVREAAAKHGVALYTLPDKVCRGFFGH